MAVSTVIMLAILSTVAASPSLAGECMIQRDGRIEYARPVPPISLCNSVTFHHGSKSYPLGSDSVLRHANGY